MVTTCISLNHLLEKCDHHQFNIPNTRQGVSILYTTLKMTIPCTSGPLYQDSTCLIDGFGLILLAVLVVYLGVVVPGCIYAYQRCVRGRFGKSYSAESMEAGLALRGTVHQISFINIQDNAFGVHYKKDGEESEQEKRDAGNQEVQILRVYLNRDS